jgi:hypothetical protein
LCSEIWYIHYKANGSWVFLSGLVSCAMLIFKCCQQQHSYPLYLWFSDLMSAYEEVTEYISRHKVLDTDECQFYKYICILDFKLCVIINCVIFWGLAYQCHGCDFFVHGKIFLLDIINGVEMSEQIRDFIIFYLYIYFIPSVVTLASHWAGFQLSFLTFGYPLLWLCVVVCACLCNSLTKLNYWHFTTL